jgi:hypothetical protein
MSSELFSVFGETSNTAYVVSATGLTSGALLLGSTLWSGYTSSIRIPKGCALKVWESKVTSNTGQASVQIQATMSGTGTVYKTLDVDSLETSGGEVRTSRSGRPLVVESHDGQRAVRFYFITPLATTTSAMVYGSYNIEIADLGVD